MIRVFDSTDKDFTSNGNAVIRPVTCYVHEVENGDYYIELVCGIEYSDVLEAGKIIICDTPHGPQPFRIEKDFVKTRTKITLKAWHVYYDSENYIITDSYVVEKNCADALSHLNAATDIESPFTTSSNMNTISSFRCVRKSLREAFVTVLERWGGHLSRDGFNVAINASIGKDNGVIIQYRKNLKDITVTENWGDVCTKCLPVGQDGQLLPEVFVYSAVQYDIPYSKVVSFDQSEIDRESYPTEQDYINALISDLRVKAQDYLRAAQYPSINYTVEANVDRISGVGDFVQVYDERLGVSLAASVISYDYNVLTGKFDKVEFGTLGNSLSGLMGGISSQVSSAVSDMEQTWSAYLQAAVEVATAEIWQELGGGYVIVSQDQIMLVDTLPASSATYCMKLDKNGISYSDSGIAGSFNALLTSSGTIYAGGENVYTSLFYEKNDQEALGGLVCGGYADTSGETLVFTLPLPKSVKNVTPSLSALKINARGINGAIFTISSSGYDVLSDADLTVTAQKIKNALTIKIEASSPLVSSGDTPINIEVVSCIIDFS